MHPLLELICEIPLEDGVVFKIASVTSIMTDFEYPGIRMVLEAILDREFLCWRLTVGRDIAGNIKYNG